MNNLSPRVVAIGKKPLRSMQGDLISQIVIINKMPAMLEKKIAVGSVQAIQFIVIPLILGLRRSLLRRGCGQSR